MSKLFAKSEDLDQTPRSAASDLGLHCLPITLLGVSRVQWVNLFSTHLFTNSPPVLNIQINLQSTSFILA